MWDTKWACPQMSRAKSSEQKTHLDTILELSTSVQVLSLCILLCHQLLMPQGRAIIFQAKISQMLARLSTSSYLAPIRLYLRLYCCAIRRTSVYLHPPACDLPS